MNAYEDGPDFDFDDIYGRDPRNPENGGDGAPDPDPDDPGPQPDDIRDDDFDDPYTGASGGGWAEPLDLLGNAEMSGHPEITPECLPRVLYNHAKAEGERMLADPAAIGLHCIGAASLVISDMWRIKPKQHDPRFLPQARVWTCVIKPPGARGTDMLRAAYKPVEQIAADHRHEYKREHAAWLESLEVLKGDDLKKAKKNEPRQKRLLTSDATVEALSELLKDKGKYGKIGYYADELTTFFDFGRYKSGKGGGGARAAMLQAFDGGGQQIDRVMRGSVYVENWSVQAAGNIQPRKLQEMGIELASDGLFQRFMVVHAKPTPLYVDDDRPINPQPYAIYRDVLKSLYKLHAPKNAEGERAPCYLDADGRAVRQRLMQLVQRLQHDQTLPELIRETASKWSGLFPRLTLIFHLVDVAERVVNGETLLTDAELLYVPAATAEKAAAFIRRVLLPNLFRLGFESLPDGDGLSHARWIAGHILTHKLDHITARDIGRACRQLRGKPLEIAAAMDVLDHADWTAPDAARTDSMRWTINPSVHTRFAAAAEAERAERAKVRDLIRRQVSDL